MNDVINVQLPSDVLLEILRRVPAANLFPLKAVCKTFNQLISSDLFARLHLIKHTKVTRALIVSTDSTDSNLKYDPEERTISVWHNESRFGYWCNHVRSTAFDLPLPRISGHRVIIDSYHGLLLVEVCDSLFLRNPITRSYKFIPLISRFSRLELYRWKIAYDDVSEKYKVFGLRIWTNKVWLYVFVVHRDSKSHLPRETKTTAVEVGSDQVIVCNLVKESVLVNDNVYWLIITNEPNTPNIYRSCIVSANITTEEVKTRSCSYTPTNKICCNFFAAKGTFYFYHGPTRPSYALEL